MIIAASTFLALPASDATTAASTLINTKRIVSEAACSCIEGYVLEAKKTCKAMGENASLLLANENTLRKIYPYAYHKMVDLHPGTLFFRAFLRLRL